MSGEREVERSGVGDGRKRVREEGGSGGESDMQ